MSRRHHVREGEGFALDVIATQVKVSGQTVIEVGADSSKAPVPQRKYVADFLAIDERKGFTRLMFGQQRVDNDKLRSLVVVHLTRHGLRQFVSSTEKMPKPTYEDIAEKYGFEIPELDSIPEEPAQAVSLTANVVLSGMSGDDSCIDFYRASPFAVRAAEQSGKFYIDPVVRVDLPSMLFIALIRELQRRIPAADETKEQADRDEVEYG